VTVTAPPRTKPRRLRYWVAGGLCLAAVAYLIVGGLGRNIVYFKTVSEAVRDRPSQGDHRFRLMGAVVTGSVNRSADGVRFDVTDGAQRASVLHHGDPPELFKDGVPVVCEGRWQGTTFDSDRIMIKHGAEYRPPSVDPSK
jgi:cytochrome c-type biogenesis protein CcmE